ncbi:MAG: hypothetical protein JNL36_07725 [Candidatus Kapabacteria bacterium]|nr:hypothetical protein [Candidatus Kapabacteria bacterium]
MNKFGRSQEKPILDKENLSTDNELLSFNFTRLQKGYTVKDSQLPALKGFLDTLVLLSEQIWQVFKTTQRESLGCELIRVSQLKRIPKDLTPDMKIFSFRFSQRGRFLGVREKNVLFVYFIDPLHQLY